MAPGETGALLPPPKKNLKSVFITKWSPGEEPAALFGYTPTGRENRPEPISTRPPLNTHKVTLRFPPSGFDLLISKASLPRLWPSSRRSLPPPVLHVWGAEPVCRMSAGAGHTEGRSFRCFKCDFLLLVVVKWRLSLDLSMSALNPGHRREVWCHEQHIRRCEEGSRSRRGGGEIVGFVLEG